MFKVPEQYRVKAGQFKSDETYLNNGAFLVPMNKGTIFAFCMASDGKGFEHVSVSLGTKSRAIERCPTWEEMCFIKDLFWSEDDVVMQLHPAKEDYVNNHKYCLHLWRPIHSEIPKPPKILVGV